MTRTGACFLLVGLSAFVTAGPAIAQEPPAARPTVAIAEFDTGRTGWIPPPQLGVTLAELLGDRLVESGQYRVLDGAWLAEPGGAERRIPASLLRERAERAGVEYLVVGSVTRFSTEKRQSTLGGAGIVAPLLLGRRGSQTESVIGLTIRVIDVRSGEVVATATSEGVASRRNVSLGAVGLFARRAGGLGFSSSSSGSREALLDEALQDAVHVAGESLIKSAPRLRAGR